MVKKGLTLIEVVVAIFLMAIVIAGGLLLLSYNLNVIKKANELTIANAILQCMIEDVKNIDFPPIYYDRQGNFGDRPNNGTNYKGPDEIELSSDGNDWTPTDYKNDFTVKRFDFRYDPNGNLLLDPAVEDTDLTAIHRIDIYVLRKRGNYVVTKATVYRTRNGMY